MNSFSKIFLIGLIFLGVVEVSPGQTWMYSNHFTGTGDNAAADAAIDLSSSSTVVLGRFNNTVNHDATILTSNSGSYDIFLVKYDNTGMMQWIKQYDGSGIELPREIAIDNDGNIYIAGGFQNTCDFDGSSIVSAGNYDGFIAKISADGTIIWAKNIVTGTGVSSQVIESITIDKVNDRIVIGGFYNTDADFGATTLPGSATINNFFAQLDTAGNVIWVKRIKGNQSTSRVNAIEADASGYYFGGHYRDSIYFDIDTFLTAAPNPDLFIYKCDFNGSGLWVRTIRGSDIENFQGLTKDNSGNIYAVANILSPYITIDSTSTDTSKQTIFLTGGYDILTVKYNSAGTFQWGKTKSSSANELPASIFYNNGEIGVSGSHSGTLYIADDTLTTAGLKDALVYIQDVNGLDVKGLELGGGNDDATQRVFVDNNGRYIAVGSFKSSSIIIGNDTLPNPNTATNDIFFGIYVGPMAITMSQTNITCFGDTTGAASVTVTTGAPPFSYSWNNGKTDASIDSLIPGTYYVTVTDTNTVSIVGSVTITQNSDILSSIVRAYPSCTPGSDGTIDLIVSGGVSPYTFSWTGALVSTDQNLTGLNAGTYNVLITDAVGCTETNTTVLFNPAGPSANLYATQLTCASDSSGAIDLVVSGGTPNYTYLWTSGIDTIGTDQDIDSLVAGTYSVTVSDAVGCSTTGAAILSNAVGALPLVSSTNPSCLGNDGSINLEIIGGTAPFSYVWNDVSSSTTQDISGLNAGTYRVTITDGSSCTSEGVTILSPPTPPTIYLFGSNPTCSPTSDGTIDLSVSGSSIYSYLWSNSATTEDLDSLVGGLYRVTVTDTVTKCTTTGLVSISNPTPPSITVIGVNPTCDPDSNGTIDVTVSGNSVYSYIWNTPDTIQDLDSLIAGTYRITVTDIVTGCTASNQVSLSNPASPILSLFGNDPSCIPGTDGTIDLVVNGGLAPYSYQWDPTVSIPDSTVEDLDSLTDGSYSVTVTDGYNCTSTGSMTIIAPIAPILTLYGSNPDCDKVPTGAVNLVVYGNSVYTYLWDNYGASTTQDISSLIGGTYSVTVTDTVTKCVSTGQVFLSNPTPPNIYLYPTNPKCDPDSTGAINLVVTGGAVPFTYIWITGVDTIGTTEDLSGLDVGNYYVTITDSLLCEASGIVSLSNPEAPSISIYGTSPSCVPGSDGTINMVVNGGNPFSYLWMNGASTVGTTEDISNLTSGTYNVTVTDDNGCAVSGQTLLPEPNAPAISLYGSNPSCVPGSDGDIDMVVSSGVTPFTYFWKLGSDTVGITEDITALTTGNYFVTVTDAIGCSNTGQSILVLPSSPAISLYNTSPSCDPDSNGMVTMILSGGTSPFSYVWMNGSDTIGNTASIVSLVAGTYNITVSDVNGCSVSGMSILTDPVAPSISLYSTNPTCYGSDGAINLVASGGTLPYSFVWLSGTDTISTDEDLSDLDANTYNVKVIDNLGCQISGQSVLVVPASPSISLYGSNPTCVPGMDGSVNLVVSGGAAPYSYIWVIGTDTIATEEDIDSLSPGTYVVSVTGSLGCSVSGQILLTQPSSPAVNIIHTDPTCVPGLDGSITITVNGGTIPYTYLWTSGVDTIGTTKNLTNLDAAIYDVVVTDTLGCSGSGQVSLNIPDAPVINLYATNPNCNPDTNGAINLIVNGGEAPYDFLWVSGTDTAYSEDLINLSSGIYNISVTDDFGCFVTGQIALANPTPPSINLYGTDPSCDPGVDGVIDLVVNGGAKPYSFIWNDPSMSTTEDLDSLIAGTYNVTVTDSLGCTAEGLAKIITPTPVLAILTGNDPSCADGDGSIDLLVSGGAAPYTFIWNDVNSSTTEDIDSLFAGTYSVTVTDDDNCVEVASTILSLPNPIELILVGKNPTCAGGSNGSVFMYIISGEAPYQYSWSSGDTVEDIDSLAANIYSVVITDNNGCTVQDSIAIIDPLPVFLSLNSYMPSCFGGDDGDVNLTVYNGSAPFTFSWSDSSTTEDITDLTAGTYYVSVSDFYYCQAIDSIEVSEPLNITISLTPTAPTCLGISNGTIDATVSGGTPQYSYNWNNVSASTTQDINSLAAGVYTLTVTDEKGCTKTATDTLSYAITLQTPLTASDPTCIGINNGEISVTVSSGTQPYTYIWSTGGTTETISNLATGAYSLTATDSIGCLAYDSVSISDSITLVISFNSTQPLCNGVSDGVIIATPDSGSAPYSYVWSNLENTQQISSLGAGTYSVTITDSIGCYMTGAEVISNTSLPMAISFTPDNATCLGVNDGTISANITNGTVPYVYEWFALDTSVTITETTNVADTLLSGYYALSVIDSNNCVVSDTVLLGETILLSVNYSTTNLTCYQEGDGSISIDSITNGNDPYTYFWSDTNATGQSPTGLSAGYYYATVSDSVGCLVYSTILLTEPALLSDSASVTDVSCFGYSNGAIDLFVSGGTTPYSFIWSDAVTLEDIDSLVAGSYGVTISDTNSCSVSYTIVVLQPDSFVIANSTQYFCYGADSGDVTVVASGGTVPYGYSWASGDTVSIVQNLPAATYVITVSDSLGCLVTDSIVLSEALEILDSMVVTPLSCYQSEDGAIDLNVYNGFGNYTYKWETPDSTRNDFSQDVLLLQSGWSYVTITDVLPGCKKYDSVFVAQPVLITATDSIVDVDCYNNSTGEIFVNPQTGFSPYTYHWSTGDSSANPSQLIIGTYSVTITDSTGCNGYDTYTVSQPAIPLSSSTAFTYDQCSGAELSITVSVFGGTPKYEYAWFTGETVNQIISPTKAHYVVTITDNNGCSIVESYDVSLLTSELDISVTSTDVTCFGKDDGSISITMESGTLPFTYIWSNGLTGESLSALSTGIYTITVTDANSCSVVKPITVGSATSGCITIYNAFTPNEDGDNDVWNIPGIENYPGCKVEVFNSWGTQVFGTEGYNTPWDGTFKNKALPSATYYYIIDLGDDSKPSSGSLTIIR